jgi:hypothetical protein
LRGCLQKIKPGYDAAIKRIKERKLTVQRNMIECPSLANLRDEATAFLTSAKRALQSVGEVFNQFYAPDGKKPFVNNANFKFAITRLKSLQPVNQNFLDYLHKVEPIAKRLVDLRNGLEHQNEKDFTEIENFQLTPKGIAPPVWRRDNSAVEGPILEEMEFFIIFLIELCKHVFFFGFIDNIAPNFPIRFQVEQLPDTEIDVECPIRFRLKPLFVE